MQYIVVTRLNATAPLFHSDVGMDRVARFGGGFRLDSFFGHDVFTCRGRVERVESGTLEMEAGRQQDKSQNGQKTFHENIFLLTLIL